MIKVTLKIACEKCKDETIVEDQTMRAMPAGWYAVEDLHISDKSGTLIGGREQRHFCCLEHLNDWIREQIEKKTR